MENSRGMSLPHPLENHSRGWFPTFTTSLLLGFPADETAGKDGATDDDDYIEYILWGMGVTMLFLLLLYSKNLPS